VARLPGSPDPPVRRCDVGHRHGCLPRAARRARWPRRSPTSTPTAASRWPPSRVSRRTSRWRSWAAASPRDARSRPTAAVRRRPRCALMRTGAESRAGIRRTGFPFRSRPGRRRSP